MSLRPYPDDHPWMTRCADTWIVSHGTDVSVRVALLASRALVPPALPLLHRPPPSAPSPYSLGTIFMLSNVTTGSCPSPPSPRPRSLPTLWIPGVPPSSPHHKSSSLTDWLVLLPTSTIPMRPAVHRGPRGAPTYAVGTQRPYPRSPPSRSGNVCCNNVLVQ